MLANRTRAAAAPTVTLETKCWEGDWERILKTDHLQVLCERNCYPFSSRMLMINNVTDRGEVCRWAQRAVEDGRLTGFAVAEEQADEALGFFGLTREGLGRGYVYSIAELVAIYLCESDYLLHFAGDSFLPIKCDWVARALAMFEADGRVRVANPTWTERYWEARQEAFEETPDWYFGYGFSDQCYLVRVSDFRGRIYNEHHPASARYPGYGGELFEKRVDSWMRNHGYVRITFRHGSYIHGEPLYPPGSRVHAPQTSVASPGCEERGEKSNKAAPGRQWMTGHRPTRSPTRPRGSRSCTMTLSARTRPVATASAPCSASPRRPIWGGKRP